MRKGLYIIICFIIFSLDINADPGEENINNDHKNKPEEVKYLGYVQDFANSLLKYGLDKYGPRESGMWASVIDVNDCSVPIRNVIPSKGVRPHDMAVGGSNYYHDVVMLKVFETLSELIGEEKYASAVKKYSNDFLHFTQNPVTGLLGWGEHLYYNFYTDTVSISESRILDQRDYFKMPHELIAWTPPWERFWIIDEGKTQKAIEGLKYHYNGPDPKVYLFNRHATWNKAEFQQEIMPWIKHAALYSYSYAYLYEKTKDQKWKNRSRDTGMLYWNLRDRDTDLVFSCYYHANNNDAGKLPSVSGTALYSYWLYKASELNGMETMKEAALRMIEAFDEYAWNEEKHGYYDAINLNGTIPGNAEMATPWQIGYGSSSVLVMGRVAAYMFEREKKEYLKNIAVKAARAINSVPLPDRFTAQNIGEAINLNMDLYEITGDGQYFDKAKEYAAIAINDLWKNGFFVRQKDDHFYEAKLGVGDLIAGFLRIHIKENKLESDMDWSF